MDRLTHASITNCIKELDSLSQLIASEKFTHAEISDWVAEVSWHLSKVFIRRKYRSDEFQHRLRGLIKENKALSNEEERLRKAAEEMIYNDDSGNPCDFCGIWIQATGNWVCEECGQATCEGCGKCDDEEEVFLCPECFVKEGQDE